MKSNLSSLAKRYAAAYYGTAKDANAAGVLIEQYRLALKSLSDAAPYIDNPVLPLKVKDEIMAKCLKGNAAEPFLRLLVQAKRFPLRDIILRELCLLLDAAMGIKRVKITAAAEIKDTKNLQEALSRYFNGKAELSVEIDKTLLAGLIVRQGDLQIDGSALGRINRLQETLTER